MNDVITCSWFPRCSGCDRIGVPYEEQLAAKLERVRDVFAYARLRDFDPMDIATIHPSPLRAGYRNRVKLVAAGRSANDRKTAGDGVALGLYREDSHEVVDIPDCPVHIDGINTVIEVIRAGIDHVSLPLYDETTREGELRFVTVRVGVGTGDILVGLITKSQCGAEVEALADYIVQRDASVVGVLHNVNPARGNVVFGRQTRLLTGQPFVEEVVCGVRVRLGLTSFFQVNTGVAQAAYEAIRDRLDLSDSDTLLDLYCGVGAIGLTAAHHVGRVFGIEEVPEAVHLAIEAAKANGVGNAEFHVGRVEDRLPRVLKNLSRGGVVESVLKLAVNPPRKGIVRRVAEAICEARPARIAYLSCAPVTLVRDLKWLMRGGYHLKSVELFDMFPQTDQVETLAVLERNDELLVRPVRRRRGRK
jgi:23S rRNA (uracil1939-C5)-methyltransferase